MLGGAIGMWQSCVYPTEDILDPSVTKCIWRMPAADRLTYTDQLAHICQAEWIYHKTETDNTAQPWTSDGKGTLIKSVCVCGVYVTDNNLC